MKAIPKCSSFGFPIGRFGRLVWLLCRACRVELAIDQAARQEMLH